MVPPSLQNHNWWKHQTRNRPSKEIIHGLQQVAYHQDQNERHQDAIANENVTICSMAVRISESKQMHPTSRDPQLRSGARGLACSHLAHLKSTKGHASEAFPSLPPWTLTHLPPQERVLC